MKFIQSPYSIFMILALLSLLAAGVCVLRPSTAQPSEPETIFEMITRLDRAPHRTLKINGEGWIKSYTESFERTAHDYDVPARLLVSIAYHESNFLQGVKGDGGRSWGVMQVSPKGRRTCECGIMETADEEIECGACWLREGIDWCGDLNSGLTAYVCGSCNTKLIRTKRKVNSRFKLALLPLLHLIGPPPDKFRVNNNIGKETDSEGE